MLRVLHLMEDWVKDDLLLATFSSLQLLLRIEACMQDARKRGLVRDRLSGKLMINQ